MLDKTQKTERLDGDRFNEISPANHRICYDFAFLFYIQTIIHIFTGNGSHLYCNLLKMLPKNVDRFYRYSGSLTTPPCSESVVWTVYPETVKISSWQVRRAKNSIFLFFFCSDVVIGVGFVNSVFCIC